MENLEFEKMLEEMRSRRITNDSLAMNMTEAQERAVEEFIRYKRSHAASQTFIREFEITQTKGSLDISIVITMDNNKEGTYGYVMKSHHQIFIGTRGGFTAYKTKKNKKLERITGRRALIYS